MRWLAGLVALAVSVQAIGLTAIDLGTDAFKVSLVAPRVNGFDLLYNKDSKRKTSAVVTLRGVDERLVGTEGAALTTRIPKDSFSSVKLLVGQHDAYGAAKLHSSIYPNQLVQTERGTTAVQRSNSSLPPLTVEEILAMQLSYARAMAHLAATDKVNDAAITIPAFFDHAERQAVLDAADLAGLKPIRLVNDGTAIAVQFAANRPFPTDKPEYHLFYDAGAGSTRATISGYQKTTVNGRDTTEVSIVGYGYDRLTGGLVLDSLLREILRADYSAQHSAKLSGPVEQNHRAMAKLLKEAQRVKHILSANLEAPVRIEGLMDDVDFKSKVSREQFEAACAQHQLSDHFSQPLIDALKSANLTSADLTSVVLVGGSSRVPLVQEAVKSVIPEDKIATNLNADEAAVMGALMYGASISKQFRMQSFEIKDVTRFAVDAVKPDQSTETVFPIGAELGSTHVLALPPTDGVVQLVSPSAVASGRKMLSWYNITGVARHLVNTTEEQQSKAVVEVSLSLDRSGIASIASAQLRLPSNSTANGEPDSNVASRLKDFFGGSKKDNKDTAADIEELEKLLKASQGSSLSLTVRSHEGEVPAMSTTDKVDARKRLREFDTAESRRKAREEARNGLEGYLYSLRDRLEDSSFVTHSTPAERKTISDRLSGTSEWLSESADTAPTKDLRQKKSELERLANVVQTRIDEHTARPKLITDLQMAIFQGQTFHQSALANFTAAESADEPQRHTRAELDGLRDELVKQTDWLNEQRTKQEKLKLNEDVTMKRAELERHARDINAEVERLRRKKAPKKAKPSSSSPSPSATSAAEEASLEASASTPPLEDSSSTTTPAAARPGDEL